MTFKWCNYIYVKNSNNGKDPKQHEGEQKLKIRPTEIRLSNYHLKL